MRISSRLDDARQMARQLLAAMRLSGTDADEAAVFGFDMNLQWLQPFTTDSDAIESALQRVAPYGQTSLYDAIADTARSVAKTAPGDRHRRAVIVLTDGIDTSSELTAPQVSGIASAIDVPVYVVTLTLPVDRPDPKDGVGIAEGEREGTLRSLAQWTGGDLFVTSAPAHESVAARQIIDELRHQYVLAFTPAERGGNWRALSVRVKDKNATVHARSGYMAGVRNGS
jgi:VWFA-related protein